MRFPGVLRMVTWWVSSCIFPCLNGQTVEPKSVVANYGKPAIISAADLAEIDALTDDRRKLIEASIALARDSIWLPYTPQGSQPSDGGFDCSGAMYFVMRKVGLDPPRTSGGQYQWLKRSARLHKIPPGVVDLNHPSFKMLHPGDLLFWGRSGSATADSVEEITHVAMFLGTEKKDKLPVMTNSTVGRSYRGIKANGYGVYDFRLPAANSKITFFGYGTPPGISEVKNP